MTNIQSHYDKFEAAKRGLALANKSCDPRHRKNFMAHLNRARAALTHAQSGTTPPRKYTPDFTTRVNGIPCGVVVTAYEPCKPATFHEPEEGEFEFFLVDRRGYKANWIKPSLNDYERLEREFIEWSDRNA